MTDLRSWEMSTIGHPLSDISNLLSPYVFAESKSADQLIGSSSIAAFHPDTRIPGIPTEAQLVAWYAEVAGWDPAPEIKWGEAFTGFRNTVIMQGIKARLFLRQATSAKAKSHADRVDPFAEHTWNLVLAAKLRGEKARL